MTSLPVQGTIEPDSPRVSNRTVWALAALAIAVMVFLNYTLLMSFGFWQGEIASIYWLSLSPLPALIATIIAAFMLPFAMLNQMLLALRIVWSLSVAAAIYIVYAALLGPAFLPNQHHDTLHMNDHVYYLATGEGKFSWTILPPSYTYLFECDAVGLICHKVYAAEPMVEYPVVLSADSSSGEIQLVGSDGEVLTTFTADP